MSYLLDTNVVSEIRKRQRCNPKVLEWMSANVDVAHFISVITLGEIRNGIELLRRRDEAQAESIERWLDEISVDFKDSILPITMEVADRWGRMNSPYPLPVADGLIAATAAVHGLSVVTRNEADFIRMGVPVVNPFS